MQIFIGGQALDLPAHWSCHDVAFLERCLLAARGLRFRGVSGVGLVAEHAAWDNGRGLGALAQPVPHQVAP